MSSALIALLVDSLYETALMVGVSGLIATVFGLPLGVILVVTDRGHILQSIALNRVLGAIWYSVLSAQWLAAIGKTTEQMAAEQAASPIPFVIGFVAILVMCYALAWLIERLQANSLAGGMGLGATIALGFVAANLALNYGFERRSVTLWVINAVYAVVGLGIAGAIIGGWKRRAQ